MSNLPTKSAPPAPAPLSRAQAPGEPRRLSLELLFVLLSCLFLAFQFRFCFSSEPFQSVDLHPHVELSRKIAAQLRMGRIFFYDPSQFSGWVVSLFYPTLAHVLAAGLALPLSSVSNDPIRLAVQSLLALSLSTLPLSLWFTVRAFAVPSRGAGYLSGIFAVWFLSLPLSSQGIGGDAAIAAGLYPQVLSWGPFLWALGLSATPMGRSRLLLPIVIATVFLLHPITALAALLLCGVVALLKQGLTISFQMTALSIGLVGFWLLPFMLAAKEWLPIHPIASSPSLFPLFWQGTSFLNRGGQIEWLWVFLAIMTAMGGILSVLPLLRSRTWTAATSLLLFASMVFLQSDFLLEHIGGSFHSYRLSGPLALLVIALALSALTPLLQKVSTQILFSASLPLLILLGFSFPESLAQKSLLLFKEEGALAQNFDRLLQRREGRTYFEYLGLSEADRHPSPHFLFSQSSRNIETLNGLFLQSSLSHRFIDWLARNLGIQTYGLPNIMGEAKGFSAEDLLSAYAPFRLNTLIVGSERNIMPLGNAQGLLRKSDGVYTLLRIPENLRKQEDKPLLVYWNKKKNLPFQYLEYFFFSERALFQKYDLFEFTTDSLPPRKVSGALINTTSGEKDDDGLRKLGLAPGTPILSFDFQATPTTEIIRGEFAPEEARFLKVQSFFRDDLHLRETLDRLPLEKIERAVPSEIRFDEKEQRIYFHTRPRTLTILPYAASPGWRDTTSAASSVLRAFPERLSFIGEKEDETLQFSYWNLSGSRSGFLLSVLAFSLWMFFVRKESSEEMKWNL